MALTLRGNVWWVDCKYKKLRHREGVGPDKGEAIKREAEVLLCLRSGRVPENKQAVGPVTMKDAVAQAFKAKWHGNKDQRGPTQRTNTLVAYFKDKPLGSLRLADVDRFVSYLRDTEKLQDPTIRRYLSCLQVVLKVAYTAELTSNYLNISGLKAGLKESRGRQKILTEDQKTQLLDFMYARNRLYGAFTEVLLLTGARKGEVKALTWSCYREGVLVFPGKTTKTGHQKTLPVGPNLASVLDQLDRSTATIFQGMTVHGYRAAWDTAREKLGFDPELVPHSIRHTVGTHLVKHVPLAVASKWLGHQNIATTMRYSHLGTQDLLGCVAVVDQKCGPSVDQMRAVR